MHNEELFRSVNAERAAEHASDGEREIAFLCECADVDCDARIRLTLDAYRRIRAAPHRFVLLPGHDRADLERVVEAHDDYEVVEKHAA